jgi:hypothetical protein
MGCGCKPSDGGHLILTETERDALLSARPDAKRLLRRFVGSDDLINGISRWCLWLVDSAPTEWRNLPEVRQRVDAVRGFRLKSSAAPTRKAADQPALFFFRNAPQTEYIAMPEVSSERRRYIPVALLPPTTIPSNKLYVISTADRFIFGQLCSLMHMAWVKIVSGRLKSDFQYSASVVYNTYPWATSATDKQRAEVEACAQTVLNARAKFPQATLADLYDPLAMPPALVRAHADLDRAVDRCYRAKPFASDRERVEHLFALYEQLTAPLAPAAESKPKRA